MTSEVEANRADLRTFLRAIADFPGHPPRSYIRLLVDQGQWFDMYGTHPRLPLGNLGFCFYNARKVVNSHRDQFSYVEGFAINPDVGIPMLHAWIVDRRNRAWDVTWPWSGNPRTGAVCGLRVPKVALDAHWRCCGGASFLNDYYHGCPALHVPAADWATVLPRVLDEIRETHCVKEVREGRAYLGRDGSVWHQEHLP